MAADDETCHGNANFAIICSFISKFGEEFGLPNSIPALQRMLEDTENVDDELKEIHIKLLRKARKWFNKEKWERALVKFCHEYSSVDAWEIERFGYKKAKLSVKLELLKRLLELQFDCNAKFKGEVNKLDALSLRVLPVGRDLNGHMYWYQLDKECNLRLYMQDVEDDMSWKLLCSTKQDLEVLLQNLGSKIDRKDLKEATEDEEGKAESKDMNEVGNEEVKPETVSVTDIKSEAAEGKSEECKVLESTAVENITIKQEVEVKSETSHSSGKECSMAKPESDDAEHQSISSMDVPPVTASDPSGNKLSLKDCTISLQSDDVSVGETNNQSCVIKPATPDNSESKVNNSYVGDKEENVIDKPPETEHLVASEVQVKPEKDAGRSAETSSGKSIEKIVSSLAERSEAPGHLCESKKDGAVVERYANAKQSEGELRKRVREEPVGERLSPMMKSSFSESIMGKCLPENLPFSAGVTVKEAHSIKVNSAITTPLLSESVSTLLDRRSVMVSKKQGEHRLLYKSPPPVRSVSMCDEVPMDLSTTGRSRESKNEPFIIPRPEHEVPGNYKTESFITKIERQLTKMCEDNESVKFNRNDRFPFSSKHHKMRRNEPFRKYHSKGIDQFHLSKMNVDKQNLSNQTNVSVIVGDTFLTKESVEQPRQSVICEIKNSKLIPNEKIHEHTDNSNHLTSSSIANSHCVSSVSPKSGLQPIEKGPDHQDKGVIQVAGSVSPPDKISFLSPRSESFNNIAISERKNLGFRKCLLNEFKADKSSLKLASSPSQMLIKDKLGSVSKLEDSMPLKKLEDMRSPSILTDSNLLSEKFGERCSPPKKCENSDLVGRKRISEEPKSISMLSKKCDSTEPVGEKQVGKVLSEGTKSSSNEMNCKQLHPSRKEETHEKEHSHKGQKHESEPLQKEENYVTEALQKEVATEALEKEVATETVQKEVVTETVQKESVTEAVQEGVTKAAQKGVTEAVQKGVTEAVQKGVTEAVQKGVTEAVQKGVTEAVQNCVTEALGEDKCVKELSQKEERCMTKSSQEKEKCVTEPSQREEKCVKELTQKEEICITKSSQEKEKCVTEPSQKEEKCVKELSQKEEKCVKELSQKEEICMTKSSQENEKCATEPSQKEERRVTKYSQEKEEIVTKPSQMEERCVTKSSQEKDKSVTGPSQVEERCVTKSSQEKEKCAAESSQKEEKCSAQLSQEEEKCVTEPSKKEEKCTTEPSKKEEKCTTEPSQKEKCATEPSRKETCMAEPSQKEEKCVTEPSQKEEKCVTEPSQKEEKCVTEQSQKKKRVIELSQRKKQCVTETSQKEEIYVTESSQKEEKCVTELSQKKKQCVTEHVGQKDKSKESVGACMKDESSELKSPGTEGGCSLLSGENHCEENKEVTKGDENDLKRLDGKDEHDMSAGSKQDKCDMSPSRKKGSGIESKCDVNTVRKKDQRKKSRCQTGTTRKKGGCRQSSSRRNEGRENRGTVSGKQTGQLVAVDLPLKADKASKVSLADGDNNLDKKKGPVSEDEHQPVEKVAGTCESAESVMANRTVTADTQAASSECETGEQEKKVCHSDASEIKDSQSICQTKQSLPVSVESNETSTKKHSSLKDEETCPEIPKLDQETGLKLCKDGSSDGKSDETVEEEKSHLKEKEANKSDAVTVQAKDESLKTDVDLQMSEVDGKGEALADESVSEPQAAKCKEGSKSESSSKKLDESVSTENGDPFKKNHETDRSGKALDDAVSEKHETDELARKEMQNEERAQVKSKLRRSSRTSRGYSEAPKIETENSGLCKSEVEKSKDQADGQKHDDANLNNSACPDVNTDLSDKNLEVIALNENDVSDKQCEIVGTANVQGNENKRRRTERRRRRSSKSTSRRSRNSRKSVRNVPKADIPCETVISPVPGDKSVSNSEVTGSGPALDLDVSTGKLDGLKIKFSPPPKTSIEMSKDIMCDIGISSVCLESKIKCESLTKIVNNKYFKSKVKESFSKKLAEVGSAENPICIDQEESFTVGRMRTRGRLKRECSAVAPPPPKEPVVKNKPAAPSPNKTPQPSQNKTASKNRVQQSRAGASPASTPRKRVRGKRSSVSKTPLPDSILEIIGNSEEKSVAKNDKVKKTSDKKSVEIVSAAFPVAENSESESIPVKRSRRIQEQNQKKISQLAVEMEQEQRRIEKLAKQNAAVAKNKQKEAAAVAEKTPKPQPVNQQQARSSKRTNKNEAKLPDPAVPDFKNSPRKTRNRSRNLTKLTLMYEEDSKDAEYETSRDTIKSRRRRNGRRGRKKKYKPWDLSSESSSPSEELTEEEEEEEQEELLVFNTNEDEFACEEIDENAEPVIIRRARTARKAKSASESESEAEYEPAPDDKPCARCGKYDEPEWILLCDKCDSGYHTRCLAPPLMIIPDGDWYCPPCEHAFLVDNLIIELRKLEQMLKQREREELRKQRLAYVGISLDNVLKPEKKEKQENESYEEEEESEESSEEDRIYSKRSSRTRRVVNYQFKEFDELIQSAIEEEMMEFRLPEKPEVPGVPADSNEDSEADVVAPSRRKKKAHRLNDLDFTDVEDSDDEYKGSSMSETEVSQSPHTDGSNSQHSGSSASWRGGRKTRSSKQKKHRKKAKNSGESDYLDGESFRPTTRRAAQKNISYRELSSDEEWGDDKPKKPTVKKWSKKRRQSSTSSGSSDGSYGKRKSKKARIVQKWKKSDSDTESEPKKTRSSSRKWEESESESESKETRKKARGVQRWEDSESASDSGSRKAKKTRTVQKWEGSESESESDSKKSSSSDSESSGTSVQSAEKWKIKKSSEGNGIKININRKVLDSDSDDDSTSGQTKHKKKTVSRIVDSEDSEESYDDASKKVSDEESTSESIAGQKSYKDEKTVSVKNVPSNSVKDVKLGPQITVTVADKVPETIVEQGPPKAAPHHVGIHFKRNASPSVQKVIRNVKPLGRSLIKSDSEHKNFDSSISETFSNDSQSLQGLPTEHEEPMCESDSEPDPKLNRFSNDQYICKTEIFEKDSVYRPAKEDQSFNYTAAEEKSYQIPYTGLSSLQDYPSRPSPLKPSMVETYSNSTSPSKLTPLDSYSEASSPKGFISLDTCSSFRKSGSFVSTDPEAKPRPILTSENYQGEIRFPPEQYPPYERPSHLSPAMCPSSPAAFPQSPSARENASPPRMYSQYPEPYAGQRSPDYYHSQQYYGREEGVQRQNYVSNYSSSENVSPYPYNSNSTQQPNGGFMIDTLLRSRNPDGEEDELTGVTDIVSYITQE